MGCNYLPLPLIPVSGTQVLISQCSRYCHVSSADRCTNQVCPQYFKCRIVNTSPECYCDHFQCSEDLHLPIQASRTSGPIVQSMTFINRYVGRGEYPLWRHGIMIDRSAHYWSVVREIHRWVVDFLHNGSAIRSFDVLLVVNHNKLLNTLSSFMWFETVYQVIWRHSNAMVQCDNIFESVLFCYCLFQFLHQ